jgi:hypothetical protein
VVSCLDSSHEVRGAQAAAANSDATRFNAPTLTFHARRRQRTDHRPHWFPLLVARDSVSTRRIRRAGQSSIAPNEPPPAERC